MVEILTLSNINWSDIGEISIVVCDFGSVVDHAATLRRSAQSDTLIVPWPQVGGVPEMTQRKIDIPIFTRIFILALHDRSHKDVPTNHILGVQERLALVEKGGILSVGQELMAKKLVYDTGRSRPGRTYHRPRNRQTIDDVLKHSIIKKLHKRVPELDIEFANTLHRVIKPHLIWGYTTTGSMDWVGIWLL